MTQTTGLYLLLGLAVVLANLPFVSRRVLGIFSISKKSGWVRVFELITTYFVVGLIGLAIESSLGKMSAKHWEFYVLTVCLFVVFAFPGFVYCFLWKVPKS